MPSSDLKLTPQERRLLLELAREAIRYGARHGRPPAVNLEALPAALQVPRATFVTLEEDGRLRGCIGSLEARRPLAEDVVHNAFAAAFGDPRFPPVHEDEVDRLDIHISVLGPLEEMRFTSEADLLRQIRPGIDGLVLEDGPYRGTFLPAVWEQLPDKRDFLRHLKLKAGLPPDYWSDTLKVYRYTTEVIE
ncbi:conserved hypothetical protein [Methylomarinovum tepidoasis]|uniref:AMMECR1 domain-containing protein n=1 Tax=Methylomarinovum tepidoasis TaxID=2840183 RepID=A0AAU9C980_9GAMM|nr:AmmeMemoRadiSam system protein A [Methylomarinovum sp. IN45]BCX88980.1 conserved hypothetical protein [Methylomarinovum sp. IN45]